MDNQYHGGSGRIKKKLKPNDSTEEYPRLATHYLFKVLVFEFRVVSLEYFMDKCSLWEINDIIDYLNYMDRNLWESQRLSSYITAQVNSRKKLTQQDICKFPWEDKNIEDFVKEDNDTTISSDDINRLKNLAQQWEQKEVESFTTEKT